ncbi:ATP-binding protein [Sphingomonas sp. OTU376]|uniref:ATP-binding protein n=1 Tax=Sphingomonas sp. OTU376 TaxID=3043863 RepID=UPI00313D8068
MTLISPIQQRDSAQVLHSLTPTQQAAHDLALSTIAGANITVIKADVGMGKSLVAAHLQARLGGAVYSLDQVIGEIAERGGHKLEDVLVGFIVEALRHDDLIFLDDFTMFDRLGDFNVVERPGYLVHVMGALYEQIITAGARLVVLTSERLDRNNSTMAAVVEMENLVGNDYFTVIRNQMGALAGDFDTDKVSRTFKKLTGYQIVAATSSLKERGVTAISAEDFIEAMDAFTPRSNLVVEDVEDVSLDSLVGVDAIVRELMRTIVIPMTQPELARELGLRPARGVLLHGEPGTGKTTIGRALARQMKGKFFIMDGSTEPGGADKLLAAAEASSPSIFFIDDADVIFRNGDNSGFVRKLLTKLDGIESESIGNVCIIMTAMDVADMPPAIVRSGRVEVWVHMELPDPKKRTDIIRHYASSLPAELRQFDEERLIEATEGFVPADLRGLVGDARGHIAFDRHKGRTEKSFEAYLLDAAEEIQGRKAILAMLSGKGSGRAKAVKAVAREEGPQPTFTIVTRP